MVQLTTQGPAQATGHFIPVADIQLQVGRYSLS